MEECIRLILIREIGLSQGKRQHGYGLDQDQLICLRQSVEEGKRLDVFYTTEQVVREPVFPENPNIFSFYNASWIL